MASDKVEFALKNFGEQTLINRKPLLTIAIPTWNRAEFLAKTLEQLVSEVADVQAGLVEVMVSDNASDDQTSQVIEQTIAAGLPVKVIKNATNIGSDANIAQCFNLARGKYVLILGDDDLLMDHSLRYIVKKLIEKNYGVVCLRAYGFEHDFRQEFPGTFGEELEFTDKGTFLTKVGPLITFISSCIINRQLLTGIDARTFCGSNLVQVELAILAIIAAERNLYINKYVIACLRNNSGGYEFSTIFVKQLGSILDKYQDKGISKALVLRYENKLLLTYYPFYLTRQRLANSSNLPLCRENFQQRFQGRLLYKFWVAPILNWPRLWAVSFGIVATVLGRTINGDLRRGLHFYWNRLIKIPH